MINRKKASAVITQEPSTFAEKMFEVEFRGETEEAIKINFCKSFLQEVVHLDDQDLKKLLECVIFDKKDKSLNLHFKIKHYD